MRQLPVEYHAAVCLHVVTEVGVAQRALQLRVQERQGVGVVPDMGAAALAAAGVLVRPLEAVEGAVL